MLIITIDIDWAPEPAIEETLDYFQEKGITPTVFITHRSPRVEASMNEIEVGLHPFFDPSSSHGSTVSEIVHTVLSFPHNIPAFRCHRFCIGNESKEALLKAGMKISSNVCTDLEVVSPFRDRFGLLEVPIFLEDGSYLWRNHPLHIEDSLMQKLQIDKPKVILVHPMHFVLNTPNFDYMTKIKQSVSRKEWSSMSKQDLNRLKWKGRGIRNFIEEILKAYSKTGSLARSIA